MRHWFAVAAAATGVLAGGCGEKTQNPLDLAAAARDGIPFEEVVAIGRSGYEPAKVRVLAGGNVTWVNLDSKRDHTVETSNPLYKTLPGGSDSSFDSHTLSWEEPYTVTFHFPGTFHYTSSLDPGWKGEVSVIERTRPDEAR